MKNNLEEIWREEFEEYYFEKINKPSRYVAKEYIAEKSYQYKNMLLSYLAANKSDFEVIERLKRNPSDFMLRCGECGNVVVWHEQYTYQDIIAGKDKEIKALKEQLAAETKQRERADELLREVELLIKYDRNKASYENPNKFILAHTEYFSKKQDKENKDEK